MTPAELAALHAVGFRHPRPWTEAEFADLLTSGHSFLLSEGRGFLLGRVAGDEAELLTLAVDPAARRAGCGRALVLQFLGEVTRRGAVQAFLEVASDNAPALALYRATGWAETGRRRAYYGAGRDALVMRHDLAAAGAGHL